MLRSRLRRTASRLLPPAWQRGMSFSGLATGTDGPSSAPARHDHPEHRLRACAPYRSFRRKCSGGAYAPAFPACRGKIMVRRAVNFLGARRALRFRCNTSGAEACFLWWPADGARSCSSRKRLRTGTASPAFFDGLSIMRTGFSARGAFPVRLSSRGTAAIVRNDAFLPKRWCSGLLRQSFPEGQIVPGWPADGQQGGRRHTLLPPCKKSGCRSQDNGSLCCMLACHAAAHNKTGAACRMCGGAWHVRPF